MDTPGNAFLALLNASQLQAVTAPVSSRVCVIAGPGTGKTNLLVSRVAHLVVHHRVAPQHIIVTTFTKKAANEMVLRLRVALEGTGICIDRLLVGTFHSLCYRILKRYGHLVGLEGYTIADDKDSSQLLGECLERMDKENAGRDDAKKELRSMRAQISSLKSRAREPRDLKKSPDNERLLLLYHMYQESLRAAKLLDFDDCLVQCLRLLRRHPVLNFVQSVLVDEFQDTNEVQLQLMYEFAKGHPTDAKFQNNVLIVGDPDQSIYAFRDAQVGNFQKMLAHYEGQQLKCTTVLLEENYRSTAGILDFSEAIMRQQKQRRVKNLRSQRQTTYKPVLASLDGPEEEARWIVCQIETLLALPGRPLRHEDIAILFRAAYQTRAVEQELTRSRIPYVMLRGKAFWERKEVVAFLDYLRVVSNDNDRLATLRTLNYPKRGIGEKSLEAIENELKDSKMLVHATLNHYLNSGKPTSRTRAGLKSYLQLVEKSQKLLQEYQNSGERALLDQLSRDLFRGSGLEAELKDDENKILNVNEVQRLLLEFEPQDDSIEEYVGGEISQQKDDSFNHIQKFVQSIGLFEADNSTHGDEKESKVTLSTIHASKGLEWQTVFVPGLSEGVLPAGFAMADNSELAADEERRCFYVATTRAKSLLYISSYTEEEGKWGRKPVEAISRFISGLNPGMSSGHQAAVCTKDSLRDLYQLLSRDFDETFDVDQFASLYKLRLSEFANGECDVSALNGRGFVSARLAEGIKKRSESFGEKKRKSMQMTFGSTRPNKAPRAGINVQKVSQGFGLQKAPRPSRESEPLRKPTPPHKAPGLPERMHAPIPKRAPFNPPRRLAPAGLKAPEYNPSKTKQAPVSAPAQIPHHRRAPAYVPVRKKL